jgi:signal transduction histidine kinase
LALQAREKADDAQLVGVSGLKDYEGPAKPAHVPIAGDESAAGWPLAEVIRTAHEVVVDDLSGRFGPLPVGRWNGRPERAIVLPLSRTAHSTPYAVLVAGISPHRALDDRYQRFFRATADQLMTAIANARAYEAEKKRAEALAEIDRAKTTFFSNVSHEFRTPARELISRVATHLEMARVRRVATDIANELAETRAALLKDVERKNQELETFSYSVSHDLRAPIRAIDGFSQALLEDHADQLNPEGKAHLQRVRAAAKRMGELIDDLLKLSRVERADLRRESVDLSRLGQRIGDSLANSEPDRTVALIVSDGLVADADARLVEIILENLLRNAWKFTRKTSSPHVELGSIVKDGQTTFYVKDNGAGFDEKYVGQLFTAFQRLHSEADFPGTGIGLATVRRIIERHGGRLWAEGKIDQGASVYWTLPSPKRGALPGGSTGNGM